MIDFGNEDSKEKEQGDMLDDGNIEFMTKEDQAMIIQDYKEDSKEDLNDILENDKPEDFIDNQGNSDMENNNEENTVEEQVEDLKLENPENEDNSHMEKPDEPNVENNDESVPDVNPMTQNETDQENNPETNPAEEDIIVSITPPTDYDKSINNNTIVSNVESLPVMNTGTPSLTTFEKVPRATGTVTPEDDKNDGVSKDQLIKYLKDKTKEVKRLSTKLEKLEEKYIKVFKENRARQQDTDNLTTLLKNIMKKDGIEFHEIELGQSEQQINKIVRERDAKFKNQKQEDYEVLEKLKQDHQNELTETKANFEERIKNGYTELRQQHDNQNHTNERYFFSK